MKLKIKVKVLTGGYMPIISDNGDWVDLKSAVDITIPAPQSGFINANEKFRWTDVENQQFNIFHYFNTDGTFKGIMS